MKHVAMMVEFSEFSDNASSQRGDLRTQLNSGEESNNCNQSDFTSSQTGNFSAHLKTHNVQKSNKCNQCDFTSSQTGNFSSNLKTYNGQKSKKCNQLENTSSKTGK